jgi:hypothetical protein
MHVNPHPNEVISFSQIPPAYGYLLILEGTRTDSYAFPILPLNLAIFSTSCKYLGKILGRGEGLPEPPADG